MQIKVALLSALIVNFVGCQPAVHEKMSQTLAGQMMDGVLAGTWQSQRPTWTLVLEKDGTISDVVRPDGLHMVLSEGGSEKHLAPNFKVRYIYGPCTWQYDRSSNQFIAEVIIEDFHISMQGNEVSNSLMDVFEGSLANNEILQVDWKTIENFESPTTRKVIEHAPVTLKRIK